MTARELSETPLGWFYMAHAYLFDAATLYKAERPRGGHYDAPVRFLYLHSIELFLKAFLRIKGFSDGELKAKRYRHDLKSLFAEAEARGMPMTKRVRRVREVHEAGGERQMEARYLRTGPAMILPPIRLHEAARDLQSLVVSALFSAGVAVPGLPRLPNVHPQRRTVTAAKARRLLSSP